MVDHRFGLLFQPQVQVHNVHDSSISNNSLREEERLQTSPTPQSFQLSQLEQVDEGEIIDQT